MRNDDPTRRTTIALGSRPTALAIYGFLGIEVGLAMIFFGTQPPVELVFGPYARLWLGLGAFGGGLLTLIGALFGDRSRRGWWAALAGTNALGIWATVMAGMYAWALTESGLTFVLPGEPLSPESGRLFVPMLYESLSILLGLHVVTLLRMGRPRRWYHGRYA